MKPNSPRILASTIAALLTWPMISHAVVRTWTGGGNSSTWSNAGNWDTGVPQNGDTIVFTGTIKTTNSNDLNDLQLAGITFNMAASPLREISSR